LLNSSLMFEVPPRQRGFHPLSVPPHQDSQETELIGIENLSVSRTVPIATGVAVAAERSLWSVRLFELLHNYQGKTNRGNIFEKDGERLFRAHQVRYQPIDNAISGW